MSLDEQLREALHALLESGEAVGHEAKKDRIKISRLELLRLQAAVAQDLIIERDRQLTYLSAARLRDEFSKLMMGRDVGDALRGLIDTRLAEEFIPELPALALEVDPVHHHKDVLAHTIAVVDDDGPLAGAVYAPVLGELFSAARGHGAMLNGSTIRCSRIDDLSRALVATGFSYSADRRAVQGDRVARLVREVRDIRRLGSAAIDLCLVACGRVDAYYEEHLNAWDLAAGVLIAAEAGAITSDFAGGPAAPAATVAAGSGIHSRLLALIAELDA